MTATTVTTATTGWTIWVNGAFERNLTQLNMWCDRTFDYGAPPDSDSLIAAVWRLHLMGPSLKTLREQLRGKTHKQLVDWMAGGTKATGDSPEAIVALQQIMAGGGAADLQRLVEWLGQYND